MDVKITTDSKYGISELDIMHEDIKEKFYDCLQVNIVLDNLETLTLVEQIIKNKTDIDLFDYSIKIGLLRLGEAIEDNDELTASERKYIKNTLKKEFGNAVLKDEITNTINTILEHANVNYYIDEQQDVFAEFIIPFEYYFGSILREYLSNL